MELRQLKYFVGTAEKLNFTEAAKALYITQSTLSQQIKQLETELGVQLFDRIGKKVYLTEGGKEFLPFAKKTLDDAEHGIQRLQDLQNIRTGVINIGIMYSIIPLLAPVISEFAKEYPYVKLRIGYHQTNNLHIMLAERKYDLIVCYSTEDAEPNEDIEPLFDTKLSVIASKKHPLAALKHARLESLNEYPLVLPTSTFYARSLLDQYANKKNIKLEPEVEMNGVLLLQELVRTGHWITILSSEVAEQEPDLKAVPLADNIVMHTSVISLKDTYVKASAQKFKEILKKRLSKK